MRIPLSDQDYVNCSREVDGAGETTGIASFAHLICQTLRGRLEELRPSGSIEPQIAVLVERVEVEARKAVGAFGVR